MKRLCTLSCGMLLLIGFVSTHVFANGRVGDRLASALLGASVNEVHQVWVYVTSAAIDSVPIELSLEAERRRARVDQSGLLIDSLDYAVSQSAIDLIASSGCEVLGASRWFRAVAVRANSTQLGLIGQQPICRELELIRVQRQALDLPLIPSDRADFPDQSANQTTTFDYGQSRFQNDFVRAVKLHEAGIRGSSVRLAVFDSGFDTAHIAFDSLNIVATYDFVNNESSVIEPDCLPVPATQQQTHHGTLVLGVVAGNSPGNLIGIAPDVEVLLAQTEITCDATEIKREEHNWIFAAEWADSAGADIITSSLGYTVFSDNGSYSFADLDGDTPLITQAADIAASKNILVVTAAGNERLRQWGRIVSPADADSVIAVGAVNHDSSLASFSSPGPTADGRIKPDIATLGVSVLAASITSAFAFVSGTSFATPIVAGVAALALSHDPTMTADELRTLIRKSGDSATPNNDVGYGLVDAVAVADIISTQIPSMISVRIGESRNVSISTQGRSVAVPMLTAINLPSSAMFTDHLDGTATLSFFGRVDDQVSIQAAVIADVGYFSDTTYFLIETYANLENPISVGPNPFSDSVRVYMKPGTGLWKTISLYTISGELVWEKVNDSPISSDVITRWQTVSWDGRNVQGETVAAGVYLMVVSAEKTHEMIKLLKLD